MDAFEAAAPHTHVAPFMGTQSAFKQNVTPTKGFTVLSHLGRDVDPYAVTKDRVLTVLSVQLEYVALKRDLQESNHAD